MTNYQIPASAIEAADKAMLAQKISSKQDRLQALELGLRAAFEELGMERRVAHRYPNGAHADGVAPGGDPPEDFCYESRWMPVEP